MKLEQITEKKHDENKDMNKTPAPGKLGDFLSSAQAAKMLGVTMSRIRQFVMEKRIKSYKPEKGRRDHVFKASEIQAFKQKDREITGRPEEGTSKVKESFEQGNDRINAKVKKQMVFKKRGITLEPGDSVILVFGTGSDLETPNLHAHDSLTVLTSDGKMAGHVPYLRAYNYLTSLKAPPSEKSLEKMSNDGVVTTPLGNRTEPDGYGTKGEPSWLLVMFSI
jgi:excisionase family DNA binding protein